MNLKIILLASFILLALFFSYNYNNETTIKKITQNTNTTNDKINDTHLKTNVLKDIQENKQITNAEINSNSIIKETDELIEKYDLLLHKNVLTDNQKNILSKQSEKINNLKNTIRKLSDENTQ